MFCKYCGYKLKPAQKMCRKCGREQEFGSYRDCEFEPAAEMLSKDAEDSFKARNSVKVAESAEKSQRDHSAKTEIPKTAIAKDQKTIVFSGEEYIRKKARSKKIVISLSVLALIICLGLIFVLNRNDKDGGEQTEEVVARSIDGAASEDEQNNSAATSTSAGGSDYASVKRSESASVDRTGVGQEVKAEFSDEELETIRNKVNALLSADENLYLELININTNVTDFNHDDAVLAYELNQNIVADKGMNNSITEEEIQNYGSWLEWRDDYKYILEKYGYITEDEYGDLYLNYPEDGQESSWQTDRPNQDLSGDALQNISTITFNGDIVDVNGQLVKTYKLIMAQADSQTDSSVEMIVRNYYIQRIDVTDMSSENGENGGPH